MDAILIKISLIKQGVSQAEIAEKIGVKQPSISQVIHRTARSRKIASAISEALGLPLASVFPEYIINFGRR